MKLPVPSVPYGAEDPSAMVPHAVVCQHCGARDDLVRRGRIFVCRDSELCRLRTLHELEYRTSRHVMLST